MTHDDMLDAVRALYRARMTGDFAAIESRSAPASAFAVNGAEGLTHLFPGGSGGDIAHAARDLFARLEMVSLDLVDSLAGDQKLATLWKASFRYDGGAIFETQLYDLWRFDDQGRVSHGLQFFDTALLAREMGLDVTAALA